MLVIGKKDYILYIILLLVGTFSICLLENFILKTIVATIPLLILCFLYLLKKPSRFTIVYFLLIPLCDPSFYSGLFNLGELLAIPTILFGLLFVFTDQTGRLNEIIYKNRHIFIPLILIPFFGLMSTLANLGNVDLFDNVTIIVFKPMFITIMTAVLFVFLSKYRETKVMHYLFFAILLSSAIVGLISFYSIINGNPEWAIDATALRVKGTFDHCNHLSGYELVMFFFALGFYFQSKKKFIRTFILLIMVLDIIALIASQTIGGLMGLIGGLFILSLMREHKLRNLSILSGIILGISVSAFFLYPQIIEKVTVFSERALDRLMVNYVGISVIKRNFWFGAGASLLEIIRSHPYLMNTPFGATQNLPHNLLISTFARGGVFYFGAFCYLLYAGFKKFKSIVPAINNSQNKDFHKTLLAGIVAFLIHNITNTLFWHARLGIFLSLFFVILVTLSEEGDFSFPSWL